MLDEEMLCKCYGPVNGDHIRKGGSSIDHHHLCAVRCPVTVGNPDRFCVVGQFTSLVFQKHKHVFDDTHVILAKPAGGIPSILKALMNIYPPVLDIFSSILGLSRSF